jgi:MFS family permease
LIGPLLEEHPPLARLAVWPAYRWLIVGTVCVGAFLGQLDASIASLVLPTLEEIFGAPVANVEWVGAAMLQATSVAIITSAVPRRAPGRAVGIQGAAQAVGLSVEPSVGGLLRDTLGWQCVFFIAVPSGLLGTTPGWLVLPLTGRAAADGSTQESERFDWSGAALLGPGIALMLLALTYGNTWGWTSPTLLLVGGAAVVCFVISDAS